MATARDSIKRAMRLLGVYSIGEDPSDDEAQDGLTTLNAMLDEFANDKLVIYAPSLDSISWTAGLPSYTVGPSGAFITPRPVTALDSSYFEIAGVSYPLTSITVDEYNSLAVKNLQSGFPKYIWINPTFPNAAVTLYPTPTTTGTLRLWSNKQIINIATLDTELELPPGYKNFIDYNLAEQMAPEYEVPVPPAVARRAALTRKTLARTNFVPQYMDYPANSLPSMGRFNIYTGQPL